jgi:hypothetical protein
METLPILYAVKSNAGLTQGVLLQLESLFQLVSVTHQDAAGPEARKAFAQACETLRRASDTLCSMVDEIIEQKNRGSPPLADGVRKQ